MAMFTQSIRVGIDVSKAELVIARSDHDGCDVITNRSGAIRQWLKSLPANSHFALEATSVYHRQFMELAHQQGHTLYLLDGFKLTRYRDSIGGRAKTDAHDARLILRYLTNEGHQLTPWSPPPRAWYRLMGLLHRRATLVRTRVTLKQSLRGMKELASLAKQIDRQIKRVEAVIEKRVRQCLSEAGWSDQARQCQRIKGVGELTATVLATLFHRGPFRSSDAFVAYLGLDVRVRDSGQQRGRRRLSKKGDSEARRLLYTAAMAARRHGHWKAVYESYLKRGLKTTQALMALARKIVRVAFALMKSGVPYDPDRLGKGCTAT